MADVRRCGRCGETKPVREFAWRRKARGQRDNYCRPCRAAYKQEHYALNRARYIDAAVRRRSALAADRAEYLIAYFATHPCVDCGESDPVVLEFDHRGDKSFNIAKGLRDRSGETSSPRSPNATSFVQTVTVGEPPFEADTRARR
jgi:hypothetical protein